MKTQKKIGWQKFEEAIKEQVNSPLLRELLENLISQEIEDEEQEEVFEEQEQKYMNLIPIPENIIGEASLASSFDCWIGHTNFNITEEVKNKVNKVDGVEILKIHSRYRFFVGIGKMFEFTKVREDIEKALL